MNQNEEQNWAEAVDIHLVQRLWRRTVRPGLINIAQAGAIIARLEGMVDHLALAERLNQRWQPVDDETGSAPIVYVRPRPIEFSVNPGPGTPNKPEKMLSRTKKGRSKDKDGRESASPLATRPPAGTSDSLRAGPVSTSMESQTDVVQRKASDAPATAPIMPVVTPTLTADTPAMPHAVPQSLEAPVEPGKAAEISTPALPGTGLAERLPLVSTETQQSAPVKVTETRQQSTPDKATEASAVTPLPVVSPLVRDEARLTTLTTVLLPAERRDDKANVAVISPKSPRIHAIASTGAEQPGADSSSQARQQPLKVVTTAQGYQIPVPENSSPTALPIVRERIMTEASAARMDRHRSLPLAGATALSEPARTGKSHRPRGSTLAQVSAKRRRQAPVTMPQAQRLSAAQDETVAPAANSAIPAAIDIDGIVHKVERRFMRRLAVEAERRRIKRWP